MYDLGGQIGTPVSWPVDLCIAVVKLRSVWGRTRRRDVQILLFKTYRRNGRPLDGELFWTEKQPVRVEGKNTMFYMTIHTVAFKVTERVGMRGGVGGENGSFMNLQWEPDAKHQLLNVFWLPCRRVGAATTASTCGRNFIIPINMDNYYNPANLLPVPGAVEWVSEWVREWVSEWLSEWLSAFAPLHPWRDLTLPWRIYHSDVVMATTANQESGGGCMSHP